MDTKGTTNPITLAIEPLRVKAMENAEKYARAAIEKVRESLAANGFDAQKVAPYPRSDMGRTQYAIAKGRYQLVRSMTKSVGSGCRSPRDPEIVEMSAERCEHFVKMAREDAESSFVAYANKLTRKIGETTAARLSGDALWIYSQLSVTLPDGSEEFWKTQQILNVSVFGKVFNQWPTRQVGGAKRAVDKKIRTVHFRDEAIFKHYTLGFACAGSSTGAYRLLRSSTGQTNDRSKVTCSRCLKALAARGIA